MADNSIGKLAVKTAPTVLPVTVAECKTAIRLDHSQHDTLIENYITAIRAHVETVCRITLLETTYQLRFDAFPSGDIELRRPPVSSVTSVKYTDGDGDEQTMDSADYHVDIYSEPPRIVVDDTWPGTEGDAPNEVTVEYVAGYGSIRADIPENIRQVIIAIIIDLYEQPGAQVDLVNGLHENKTVSSLLHGFRRITLQ